MTILVTDPTGPVGRHLVRQLLAGGHAVRALTRPDDDAALPPPVEAVEGDLREPATLGAAFDGVAAAHLVGFDPAELVPLPDAEGVVRRARTAGVGTVTVLRDGLADGPLDTAVAEDGGLAWTSLAPTELMANALQWAVAVREDGEVADAFPEVASALVHEADVAAVAAAALTTPGHAHRLHRLTGPQALTPPEQVRVVSDVLGREVRYRPLSMAEITAEWRRAGYSAEEVEGFLALRADPSEAESTVLPTVEHVTGRAPRTFAEWVRENVDAFGGPGVVTG